MKLTRVREGLAGGVVMTSGPPGESNQTVQPSSYDLNEDKFCQWACKSSWYLAEWAPRGNCFSMVWGTRRALGSGRELQPKHTVILVWTCTECHCFTLWISPLISFLELWMCLGSYVVVCVQDTGGIRTPSEDIWGNVDMMFSLISQKQTASEINPPQEH